MLNWANVPRCTFHLDNLTKKFKNGTPFLVPGLDFRRESIILGVLMSLFFPSASQTKKLPGSMTLSSRLPIFKGCINVGHFGDLSGPWEFQTRGSWTGVCSIWDGSVCGKHSQPMPVNQLRPGKDFLPSWVWET